MGSLDSQEYSSAKGVLCLWAIAWDEALEDEEEMDISAQTLGS